MSGDFDTALRLAAAARRGRQGHGTAAAGGPSTATARATVIAVSPLRLDLHGSDLKLDEDDVELSQDVKRTIASEGLSKGDVLVVTEVDEGDWIASTVVSTATVRAVPGTS